MPSDSHNLHITMVRLYEHRGRYPTCPNVSGLISALGDVQHGIESGLASDEISDRCIDLGALALRIAAEYQKPSAGLPMAKSTTETPRSIEP